jgi:hypothetical protein
MLSKIVNGTFVKNTTKTVNVMSRGVYTKETKPHVYINQHTKVLVQGMTGKHVSTI